MKQLINTSELEIDMDTKTVTEILRIAAEIDSQGFTRFEEEAERQIILGKMFYGATSHDQRICDLAAARLGMQAVDLSWADVDFTDSATLLDQLRMSSEVVDLLITAFSSNETFGDGRRLTTKFPESSDVPIISLHDDFYDWQSSLSQLFGFQKQLGDLKGKQIVVNWAFGSSFLSPAIAHGFIIASALLGADVRVVAPPEFSLLNRARRKAKEITEEADSKFEETSVFADAFGDADAVFSLNWFRLDDFNHPERNRKFAGKYKDWYMTPDTLSKDCLFSTEPPLQTGVMLSPELAQDSRNISGSWMIRRVHVLAATLVHVLRESWNGGITSVV
jgi:ornithine carbamoyltransferase